MHTNVILTNKRCTHAQSNYTNTKQDHKALLKAKYCPRVAAASCTQRNT